eukprot:6194760-Pleurochrysis_carterae.AAC.2
MARSKRFFVACRGCWTGKLLVTCCCYHATRVGAFATRLDATPSGRKTHLTLRANVPVCTKHAWSTSYEFIMARSYERLAS